MVKKLLGYELKYYAKYLTPAFIILAAISLLLKGTAVGVEAVIDLFKLHWGFSMVATVLSCITLYMFIFLFAGLSFYLAALAVIRYYKNLYSSEGYLTLSLPVSATAHVGVKLVGYLIALATTLIMETLSIAILISGELTVELVKSAVYMLLHGSFEFIALPVALIVSAPIAAVASVFGVLVYYTCISIGQRFNKNRIFASVGAYVGYCIISYVLSMIFAVVSYIVTAVVAMSLGFIGLTVDEDFIGVLIVLALIAPTIAYLISVLFYAVASVVLFIFNKNTLQKKINLE